MRRQQSLGSKVASAPIAARGVAAPTTRQETTITTFEHYSGPVAHPEIGEGWERVVVGGGDRLLTMAEKQGDHRRHIEKVAVWGRTLGSNVGTFGGIAIALVAMYFGYDLLMHDKDAAGLAAFFGPLAVLVWAYRRESKPTPQEPPTPKRRKQRA